MEVRMYADKDVCDFCTSPHLSRAFGCEDFEMSPPYRLPDGGTLPGHWSRKGWAACAECAALIDAAKWNELAERSLTEGRSEILDPFTGRPVTPEIRAELKSNFLSLHQKFQKHRVRALDCVLS